MQRAWWHHDAGLEVRRILLRVYGWLSVRKGSRRRRTKLPQLIGILWILHNMRLQAAGKMRRDRCYWLLWESLRLGVAGRRLHRYAAWALTRSVRRCMAATWLPAPTFIIVEDVSDGSRARGTPLAAAEAVVLCVGLTTAVTRNGRLVHRRLVVHASLPEWKAATCSTTTRRPLVAWRRCNRVPHRVEA